MSFSRLSLAGSFQSHKQHCSMLLEYILFPRGSIFPSASYEVIVTFRKAGRKQLVVLAYPEL